jgi:hypothetical protein
MRNMEWLKRFLEDGLNEASTVEINGWNAIEGEEATYGVELADGSLYFITITEA